MSELMRQFDSVCTTNGDDTAFYTSQYNSNSLKNGNRKLYSVGFSELNSNINLIASELHNRHSIRPAFTSSNRPTPSCIPTEEFMKEAGSRCILIVSDQPSPGEAAAVMACTRLHITFVPLALGGPHRTNDSRVKVILQETQPIAAVVVLSLPDDLSERHEDDWEMRPALSSNEFDVDSHPAVIRLNHLGVHRIITVKGQDGSVIGSMAGLADGDLDLQTEEKIEEDGRDPMYILYTSGSTSKPKAVMQTYAGLWNRIRWQWRTFPFVQQMRRNIGLKETMNLLRKDGILPDDDLEKMHEINDIILRRTSLSFVDSMAEIFGTLLGGASLFCPLYIEEIHETKRQGLGLVGMLDMASRSGIRITRMTCLPSQLSQAFCHHNKKKAITRSTKNPDWTETLDLVVVSGEPCPRSLPLLFDQIIEKEKGLLVNLYGQTETSGDVSCLVASSGNSGKLLLRFPDAKKYIWKSFRDISERGDFINKCSQTLIPCGLPIDGHRFTINPVVSEHGSARKDYGCLFVSGPGIAVGYFNNRPEMLANFMKLEDGGGNDDGYAKDRILFNTMDIAFEDGNGFIFVIGRAAKDAEDAVGTDGTGCSLTMGKVNGVLIHAAEIEDIFSSSLKAILFQHGLFREISRPNVIALLYNDTETGENKSAVFVDLTSFPYNSITFKMNVVDEYVIESSNVGFEASEMSFHDVVIETRSTILRNNHPSMVPHFIHLMSSVPTNGAAGKINRSYLANMLAKKLTEKKKKTGLENGNGKGATDSILEAISSTYSAILGLNAKEIQDRPFTTFPELGGDSMMAINASHLILSDIRKIGYKLSDDQKITPIDIMQLPLQALLEILENGRKALPPEAKKQRITGNSNDEGNIENLSSHAIAYSYNICTQDDSSLTISKNWKMPLKMCVDSRSLVINKGDDNVIISGSQGGDLACICSSGKLLSRTNVTGKIEGDLNFLAASLQTDMDPIIFVPTYVSSHDQAGTSTSGNEGKPGTGNIHALKLSKSNSLIPIWTYNTNGDIKSKPMIFTYPNSYKTNTHRLLTASYDGSLSYLDAITGELLQKKDGLGGAIHADPIVLTHESPNTDNTDATVSAIVASCTWKGKVTCLTLTQTSMEIKWEVDLWTPIYASPYVNPSRCKKDTPSVILCGIDGSVRSLNCNNGEEIWKTETGTKPIFTKCCRIDPSSEANTGQIILGSNDGKLRCIHESNGVIQWTINVHAPILSSPICSMDHIICATTAGSVLVFDKVPLRILVSTDIDGTCTSDRKQPGKDKTKYISAQANVPTEALTSVRLEGEIFSSPVAKGNDIYIGCRDSCLYKLTLDNK